MNTHLLIAGGGIGGLALAIAARRAGMAATVLERSTGPRETGSGLVLSPNGMKALAAVSPAVAADVRAAGSVSGTGHRSGFVTARGQVLATMSFADMSVTWGAPVVSLRRSRLHAVLADHAERAGAVVRTEAVVDGYVESASSVVAAGVTADVLVGSDGLRSAVRAKLLDDDRPTYLGYTPVRGIGPAPTEWPNGYLAYGRGLILFASPVDGGRLYWVASITAPEGIWPAKGTRTAYAELLSLLDDWAPELTDTVRGCDTGDMVLTDIYDRDPVARWSSTRVTLLGDAAHPMAYTMGQGANMAFEDAATLAHRLATASTIPQALQAYERDRTARTAKVVKASRMMGRIGHARNPIAAWARDRMISVMSRVGEPGRQNAEVFGWSPPGERALKSSA